MAGTPHRAADDLAAALLVFSTHPDTLSAVVVRAWAGPRRSRLLELLRLRLCALGQRNGSAASSLSRGWLSLPHHAAPEHLESGLDIGLSLSSGRPVRRPGLLDRDIAPVIVVPMAERLTLGLATALADALDQRRACLILLDESLEDEPRPWAGLLDRMAMTIDLRDESLFADVLAALEHVMPMAAEAEREVSQPRLSDEQEETLTGAAVMLDVASSRPLTHAAAVARACAVQRADPVVGADDIALAIRLALVPHARRLPQFNQSADDAPAPDEALSPDTASDPANEAPSPAPEHGPEDDPSQDSPESALPDGAAERLVEAALATLPPEVLADLAGRAGRRTGSSSAAGAGQLSSKGRGRGRSIGARRGLPQGGARVHLFATLRAAMPWQRWRERVARMRSEPLSSASGPRLRLSKDDLHIHREVHRRGTTTLFVVDASGSTALQRLNEAKGAVELLLADCYVRRDRVALICFRGRGAEMLLAPTRSLVAARRALSALPGGGGSPVAAGLELALRVASGVGRAGDDTQLVVLTDGRANLTRDGRPGREEAARDAQAMARELSRVATHRVLIDTSLRPEPAAQRLAEALSARYCPMPFARAQAIRSAIG